MKNNINSNFNFDIIIATVDIDQEPNKVKEDFRNIVNYICDYKQEYTQILVVECSDNFENFNQDYLVGLANYTCAVERECTRNGWGSDGKKNFQEQFLNSCMAPSIGDRLSYEDFFNTIVSIYDSYSYFAPKKNLCFIQ